MANRKHIEAAWLDYQRSVIPAGAPPVQHKETRRAFYAGAWAVLTTMLALGDDDVSEDQGADEIENIRLEIQQFLTLVAEGGDRNG